MTVLDSWSGGASGFRQFTYRLAALPDGTWRLDVKPLGAPSGKYQLATATAGHGAALRFADYRVAEIRTEAAASAPRLLAAK